MNTVEKFCMYDINKKDQQLYELPTTTTMPNPTFSIRVGYDGYRHWLILQKLVRVYNHLH
jgi:hypothetical protein